LGTSVMIDFFTSRSDFLNCPFAWETSMNKSNSLYFTKVQLHHPICEANLSQPLNPKQFWCRLSMAVVHQVSNSKLSSIWNKGKNCEWCRPKCPHRALRWVVEMLRSFPSHSEVVWILMWCALSLVLFFSHLWPCSPMIS
jgi:hypothetical protein